MTENKVQEIISTTFTESEVWAVIIVDLNERIEYFNLTCKDIFATVTLKTLDQIFPQALLNDLRGAIAAYKSTQESSLFFKECHECDIVKDGDETLLVRVAFHYLEDDNTPSIVITFRNIAIELIQRQLLINENHKLEALVQERTQDLEKRLYLDSVTGLKSRQALMEDIGKSSMPTLFLIDINDYSRYIDIYGSEIAMELLKMFSELLEAFNEDKGYQLYHIENNIFCMLYLSDYIDTDKYEADIFELIDVIIENPLFLPCIDDTLYLDVTVGICSETENTLNHAYDALLNAKKTKKRFVYYHPFHAQTQEHRNILNVKKEIQNTIEANNFVPVYQPIVDREGKIIKYETLLRMRQNDKLVSPVYFLDIAAKTNQYEQISHKTLIQAVETFKDRDEFLSLNFTQADINNKALLRDIEQLLQKYKMTKRTIFEIVESDAIEDYESTQKFVEYFRAIGIRIAIDDFGSGYANFSHIMELEPEYLKIDGSLIKDITKNKKSLVMVKAITQFAKDLGIKVIGEYVADKDIFEILLDLGVDEFQGFYFGKPEPLQ